MPKGVRNPNGPKTVTLTFSEDYHDFLKELAAEISYPLVVNGRTVGQRQGIKVKDFCESIVMDHIQTIMEQQEQESETEEQNTKVA